jgi:hypothetical protein
MHKRFSGGRIGAPTEGFAMAKLRSSIWLAWTDTKQQMHFFRARAPNLYRRIRRYTYILD